MTWCGTHRSFGANAMSAGELITFMAASHIHVRANRVNSEVPKVLTLEMDVEIDGRWNELCVDRFLL